ncbi:MAG: ATP-binding cassette domain-containing protein [Gammaproteobacteria bacterium]|nr:MAG: ATP-binding cassette domain-containing protein [Gammaproteobacteria bacterium]
MRLIHLKQVSFSLGDRPILRGIDLTIHKGDKIGLIGRNGTGKSTLLRIITGELHADEGTIERNRNCRITRLEQETDLPDQGTVLDAVAARFQTLQRDLNEYQCLTRQLEKDRSPELLQQLETLQHRIEAEDGWQVRHRIEAILSKLELDPKMDVSILSGGLRRRVALARAILDEPDLLCLDEPTNHLDIQSITWLESFMRDYPGSFILITHDRHFLNRVVNTIIELNQCRLIRFPGNYNRFMERRDALLAAEAEHQAQFEKNLAQEEDWIRQGVKARRTRNQGRVRKLLAMRKQHQEQLRDMGALRMDSGKAVQSGNLVIEAQHLTYRYEDVTYIDDFSAVVMRGDKIGIIGPNGCGKSTLLKMLVGDLPPTSGKVRHGTRLQVRYFDQERATLDGSKTVIENLSEGRSFIEMNGKQKHVISYLQDFLFSPDRAHQTVSRLSGGEKARLLLAKLFSYPSNVLVMDEPTNDLDIETIELLEELLIDYPGTVLLVSHDRQFMENIVTYSWVFRSNHHIEEFPGDFNQWERLYSSTRIEKPATTEKKPPFPPKKTSRKLGYKEQRELDQLPDRIEALEQQQQTLQATINAPDFYKQDQEVVQKTLTELETLDAELEKALNRWEELESWGES